MYVPIVAKVTTKFLLNVAFRLLFFVGVYKHTNEEGQKERGVIYSIHIFSMGLAHPSSFLSIN